LLFKKNKNSGIIDFDEMSPLEVVTYLFVYVMLSDNQISFEEKESWKESIQNLFPDHLESRTENFFNESYMKLSKLDRNSKKMLLYKICNAINNTLDKKRIGKLGKMLGLLIKSDGIVMSSEKGTTEIIETNLNIVIRLDNNT
tara:strand:+ start:466 stop:894 length:429 start_codon:yes stop_codon:yes gene_type:complete